MYKNLFNNINGYPLDKQQIKAATSQSKYSMIIAGAGSGKSTTIIGKIIYLVNILNVNPQEILCISFTNEASHNLKENILKNCNINIEVNTFHKLALNILKNNKINFKICSPFYLDYIIEEYFKISHNHNIRKNTISFIKNKFYINNEKEYERLISNNDLYCLKKLITTFINLYRTKYNSKDYLEKLLKTQMHYKDIALLKIIYTIYTLYEDEKRSQNFIDFDDMIYLATSVLSKDCYIENYKYIIIDEFQDTSKNRLDLIKAILNKTHASLTVVGDDFQSIYKFSGCNLDLFLNFPNDFENVEILKIENTYRNSQELINVAGDFIAKNPLQLKKDLKSNKSLNKPIKIVYDDKIKLKKLLSKICQEYNNILILGRNNFDMYKYLDNDIKIDQNGKVTFSLFPCSNIRFLSIHKSKGLEADVCIVLNLENSKLGFPNQIIDYHILNYINCKETYPYEEERRLFYVALTRSKNYVYLISNKNKESIFIKELNKYYKKHIEILKK